MFNITYSGLSPTALEWDMKLWWVHLEAMVATLMVFETTKKEEHWDSFKKVFNYSFEHVSVFSIRITHGWVHLFFSVPSAWWRVGWLPGQTGEGQDGLQGGPLQGLLPLAQGADDL